jgi:hypothetical protein
VLPEGGARQAVSTFVDHDAGGSGQGQEKGTPGQRGAIEAMRIPQLDLELEQLPDRQGHYHVRRPAAERRGGRFDRK